MRIRKRRPVVVTTTTPIPQPISFKYHTGLAGDATSTARVGADPTLGAECRNMQGNPTQGVQDLEDCQDWENRGGGLDVNAAPPALDTLRLSDAHVKDEAPSHLQDDDEDYDNVKPRRRQASPKRRKIEHESSLLFEGIAFMTAAELLVVNELANGVRQRLHVASEHSATTTEVTKPLPPKPVENSKDALISSIFSVFGTCGEHGLSASEVVNYMLDHRLPGLKEGGARHTVQVANVLRSSSSFISLGDKKYLLCSSLDDSRPEPLRKPSSRQPPRPFTQPPNTGLITSPSSSSPGKHDSDIFKQESSENEDVVWPQQRPRIRAPSSKTSHSRSSSRKPEPKPKASQSPVALLQDKRRPSEGLSEHGELPDVMKTTTRRRGPSSSQKGKGSTQCKRYDGRGWRCSRLTEPGYSLCVHHQDLINKRAAKLKEQQTLSRLVESQHRKLAKAQQQQQGPPQAPLQPPELGPENGERGTENGKQASSINGGAPLQKRKMLSLLAIK